MTPAYDRGTEQARHDLAATQTTRFDPHLYAPNNDDHEPWCHFGKGTTCLNRDQCRNPHHRKLPEGET